MREFSQRHDLSACAEQVIAMITAEDYLRFRYEDPRLVDFSLDITRDDEQGFACRIERVVSPGKKVPAVAKRLLGNRFTVLQKNEWQRSGPPFLGKLSVSIPGMPGSIDSDLELAAVDAQRSQLASAGRIAVNIPIAGGQIERMLTGLAQETFSESVDKINEYIASQK